MTTTFAPAAPAPRPATAPARRYPRKFLISLWSIPVLVIGQFAMLAIIPVVLVLVTALRDARLRAVRKWSIALAAVYTTPLVIWITRPDGAKSLSKDMHPIFLVLIAAAAAITLIRTRTPKS